LKVHVDGAGWDDALACVAGEYPEWKLRRCWIRGTCWVYTDAGADLASTAAVAREVFGL
jgi:hypothetical protein